MAEQTNSYQCDESARQPEQCASVSGVIRGLGLQNRPSARDLVAWCAIEKRSTWPALPSSRSP